MASGTPQGAKLLYGWRRAGKFECGSAALLPEAYLKFFREWKKTPKPVHFIPKEGKWERDEKTGLVSQVQNVPIPVMYPQEQNQGIWGGEGVVKGFQKRNPYKKRVPHYWVPVLRRTVLHSVVLNKYFSTVVTERTMDLIHENHGFDHYLLKREILQALQGQCPDVSPEKKSAILEEYSDYLKQYIPEEIEWYGYTFEEAIRKINIKIAEEQKNVVPHKIEFRSRLIQQLKEAGIAEAQENASGDSSQTHIGQSSSWLSKMNPFGKKPET